MSWPDCSPRSRRARHCTATPSPSRERLLGTTDRRPRTTDWGALRTTDQVLRRTPDQVLRTTPDQVLRTTPDQVLRTMSELDALQAALAGEHACVWAWGLAGGLSDPAAKPAALAADAAHRRQRDVLTEIVLRRGEEPVAALPAYGLPFPVTDAASGRALVAVVEERLAAVYADLVAEAGNPGLRALAAEALRAAATAAAASGGGPAAFPGLPERDGS